MSESNSAIVWVHESSFGKLAHGIVLPDGYTLADRLPFTNHQRQSVGFVVESSEIPHTAPAVELPCLSTLTGYQCVVVERWRA